MTDSREKFTSNADSNKIMKWECQQVAALLTYPLQVISTDQTFVAKYDNDYTWSEQHKLNKERCIEPLCFVWKKSDINFKGSNYDQL